MHQADFQMTVAGFDSCIVFPNCKSLHCYPPFKGPAQFWESDNLHRHSIPLFSIQLHTPARNSAVTACQLSLRSILPFKKIHWWFHGLLCYVRCVPFATGVRGQANLWNSKVLHNDVRASVRWGLRVTPWHLTCIKEVKRWSFFCLLLMSSSAKGWLLQKVPTACLIFSSGPLNCEERKAEHVDDYMTSDQWWFIASERSSHRARLVHLPWYLHMHVHLCQGLDWYSNK